MIHTTRTDNASRATSPSAALPPLTRGLALALLATALHGCGGGGGGGGQATVVTPPTTPPPVTDACGVDAQKSFVRDVAEQWYLWYDELAPVNAADYDSAEAYLSALTAPLAEDFRDPGFSYLTTVAEDEANFSTGAYVGFGFRFATDGDGRYRVSDVFEGGAAAAAGFVRGAEIVAVDRGEGFVTMREFEQQGATLEDIFGPPEIGLTRGFRLIIDGEEREVSAAKTELDIPPLADTPLLLSREGLPPAGYLHLRSFTTSAIPALEEAFTTLSSEGVTDFVIDLRYNGGGSLNVAAGLLDLLGGSIADGELAYRVSHNDQRSSENFDGLFNEQPRSVAPNRIAFITSGATASASELIINSLAPHAEVVLIGSDTLGKAVGQYAFDQRGCDTRLRLVTFEIVNGDGLGGYYTGLVDTGRFTLCAAEDSYTGAFGDPSEGLIGSALGWLNEGVCSVAIASDTGASRALRRGPQPLTAEERPDRRSPYIQ